MHQLYHLIVVHPNFMYLSCKFRELAVVLHGGLVHRYHLETLSKNTGSHKVGFAYCPRFIVQVDGTQLVFHIGHTGVPSVPVWNFYSVSVSVTILIGYF